MLAHGLTKASAREGLYAALQASPLVEHKVLLKQLLASDAGMLMLEAMGTVDGMQVSEVRALAEALPPLDVYLPHSQHRDTWQPHQPVAVAALLDRESQITAHVGDRTLSIDRRSSDATSSAVLLLAPVEPKAVRAELRVALAEGTLSAPSVRSLRLTTVATVAAAAVADRICASIPS